MKKALSVFLFVGLISIPALARGGGGFGGVGPIIGPGPRGLIPKTAKLVLLTRQLEKMAKNEVSNFPAIKRRVRRMQHFKMAQIKRLLRVTRRLNQAAILYKSRLVRKRTVRRLLGQVATQQSYLQGTLHELFRVPRKGSRMNRKIALKFRQVKRATVQVRRALHRH